MRFNSVIFHSNRLEELRNFYEGQLGLPLGFYEKDGEKLPDYSNSYVNYHLDGGLLCFEVSDDGRTDLGSVVLNIKNFSEMHQKLQGLGMEVLGDGQNWFKIKDPEGRILIFEPC